MNFGIYLVTLVFGGAEHETHLQLLDRPPYKAPVACAVDGTYEQGVLEGRRLHVICFAPGGEEVYSGQAEETLST